MCKAALTSGKFKYSETTVPNTCSLTGFGPRTFFNHGVYSLCVNPFLYVFSTPSMTDLPILSSAVNPPPG